MNQIYFTADLHFGHSNILKHSPKRPFSDTVDIYNAATEKIKQYDCNTFMEYAQNNYRSEVR